MNNRNDYFNVVQQLYHRDVPLIDQSSMPLLKFTDKGIYCPQADVYIDPWKKVKKALITHGHSDHVRWGHEDYLCTHAARPVIEYRLGKINCSSIAFGEAVNINGVRFSFHPAGHIIGSAQIRVEYKGEIWVASGDYKVADDGLTESFDPIRCHHFITESTFGLPIYRWESNDVIAAQINAWWRENKAADKVSIILGYSLGKAQRILHNLDTSIGQIYTHGAVENINNILRNQGIALPPTTLVTGDIDKKNYRGNIIVAPPSALGISWVNKFKPFSVATASGWMMLRGTRRRRNVDRGFVLSDHADWDGLLSAIKATGAENIHVTHGYVDIFSKYLNEIGYNAGVVSTAYEGELSEIGEGTSPAKEMTT